MLKEKKINEKIYQKLIFHFNSKINQYPFNNLSQNQILLLENEYTEYKIISPYKFIENKYFGKLFNKIYEFCFLKCEPLLNNINDDKKIVNLLFFRTIIVLLRETILEKTIEDIKNSLIELSFDKNINYINKDKFKIKIKSFSEICYQILFYFFIACNQFTEAQYYEFLNNPNILLNEKYSNVDIDNFCLHLIFENDTDNYKLEDIIGQWTNYICDKIDYDELNVDNFNKNNIKISSIKNKIQEMLVPYKLLEVLSGLKLTDY